MTAPADSSIPSKVLSIDDTIFVFFFIFFRFTIDNYNCGSFFSKGIKMKIFLLFTIIYPKINMNVVKAICLGNSLPTHIRENIDFPWQKPRQWPSVETNFED